MQELVDVEATLVSMQRKANIKYNMIYREEGLNCSRIFEADYALSQNLEKVLQS